MTKNRIVLVLASMFLIIALLAVGCAKETTPTPTPAPVTIIGGGYYAPPTATPPPTETPTPTPTPTPIPTDVPLGETGGVHYADGCFVGVDNFTSLYVDITIYTEPDNKDGLYFQLYQSKINGVGFYFGLLTGRHYLDGELIERFVLFSRWGTNDLENVRTVEGGWSEKGDDNGPFVGVRKASNWTTHRYRFKLGYVESDSGGDWYGMWVNDIDENLEVFCGSIRFPFSQSSNSGIDKCSTSWIEIYYKDVKDTPIPRWHVSIDGICATDQMIGTREMRSLYSNIQHTDIYYDVATKAIHFVMSPEMTRQHDAGALCLGDCFRCAH